MGRLCPWSSESLNLRFSSRDPLELSLHCFCLSSLPILYNIMCPAYGLDLGGVRPASVAVSWGETRLLLLCLDGRLLLASQIAPCPPPPPPHCMFLGKFGLNCGQMRNRPQMIVCIRIIHRAWQSRRSHLDSVWVIWGRAHKSEFCQATKELVWCTDYTLRSSHHP